MTHRPTSWTPFTSTSTTHAVGRGLEMRRSLRLPLPAGRAVCEYDGRRGLYDIVNISASGLLLEGRPELPQGALCAVRVLCLQLPPFVVLGRVAHSGPFEGRITRAGLALDVRASDVQELMRQLMRAAMALA